MPAISGKRGTVTSGGTSIAQVTDWQLRTRAAGVSYASSETGGFRKKLSGVKQASGALRFVVSTAAPQTQLAAGDAVTLHLHLDASRYISLPARIDGLRLQVNIDTGQIIGGQFDFSSDGAWTLVGLAGE